MAGPSTFDSSLFSSSFLFAFFMDKTLPFLSIRNKGIFFKKKSQHDEPRHNQINIHAKVQAKHISLHK